MNTDGAPLSLESRPILFQSPSYPEVKRSEFVRHRNTVTRSVSPDGPSKFGLMHSSFILLNKIYDLHSLNKMSNAGMQDAFTDSVRQHPIFVTVIF